MKKFLIFFAGMVTGAVLVIAVSIVISLTSNQMNETEMAQEAEKETAFYEGFENGEIINESSFQVLQVLEDNVALVHGKDKEVGMYIGTLYLLIGKKGTTFYDEQIVKVPQGSVVRMNGTYKYQTQQGMGKTVPRIMIMDK